MLTANTWRRMMAHGIDELLSFLFFLPLLMKLIFQIKMGAPLVLPYVGFVACAVLCWSYEITCLYLISALPGQWMFGMKVISVNHSENDLSDKPRLSLAQCIARVLAERLSIFMTGLGYFGTAFWNQQRRHLGDILSETRVVQDSPREHLPELRRKAAIALVIFGIISGIGNVVSMGDYLSFTKKAVDFSKLVHFVSEQDF